MLFPFHSYQQVKFKIASCHSSLNENKAAIVEVCFFSSSLFYRRASQEWLVSTCYQFFKNNNENFPVSLWVYFEVKECWFSIWWLTMEIIDLKWIYRIYFASSLCGSFKMRVIVMKFCVMLLVRFRCCHSSWVACVKFKSQMEGIPSKARNLSMNLLLGKLYRISRHSRAAVAIYKECLRFVK